MLIDDEPEAESAIPTRMPLTVTEPGRAYDGQPKSWTQNLAVGGGFINVRHRVLLWTDDAFVAPRLQAVQRA